jgi:hypothetical protein
MHRKYLLGIKGVLMRRRLIFFVVFFFFSLPLQSHADFQNGNDLLTGFDAGYASGYIIGVFVSFEGIAYCATTGVTQDQVRRVARKYLEAHPAELHRSAAKLLVKAFTEAFPCPTR